MQDMPLLWKKGQGSPRLTAGTCRLSGSYHDAGDFTEPGKSNETVPRSGVPRSGETCPYGRARASNRDGALDPFAGFPPVIAICPAICFQSSEHCLQQNPRLQIKNRIDDAKEFRADGRMRVAGE